MDIQFHLEGAIYESYRCSTDSVIQLITIDGRKVDSHSSCRVHPSSNLVPTTRHTYRMIVLASMPAYIAFHLISWHVFGIEI